MVMRSRASSRITPQHLLGQLRVQGAGGLVKAEDFRVHAQGAGDGHPLLLAAGQLVGVLVRLVGKADLGPAARARAPWPAPGEGA